MTSPGAYAALSSSLARAASRWRPPTYGLGRDQIVFTRPDEAASRSALGHLAAAHRNHPDADLSAQRQALAEARESRGADALGDRLRANFTKAVRAINAKAAERERDRKAGRTALPPLPSVPPETSLHDLRHHYASTLIEGGESVVVVARRLGHANPSMTLDVYSHLFADSEERTRSVVDAAWSAKINQVADSVRTSDGAQVTDLRR